MSGIVKVVKERNSEGKLLAIACWMWCPGCDLAHRVSIWATNSYNWEWNKDEEKPTFSPSILVRWTDLKDSTEKRCHSFVRDGKWEFLSDSTHALAGQTVPLEPVPDWVAAHHERGHDD